MTELAALNPTFPDRTRPVQSVQFGNCALRQMLTWGAGIVWVVSILTGFWIWERYDATPGPIGADQLEFSRTAEGWTLTVFAHPRCPCTRGTLRVAAEIAEATPQLNIRVWFVLPAGVPGGWERGESWEMASRIDRATVGLDRGGAVAHSYGALTSGMAVLTDPGGWVVFHGGLTPGRNRVTSCPGREAVLDLVRGTRTEPFSSPVFGCPLEASSSRPSVGERVDP